MNNQYRVISIYSNFANQGGAQDITLQLAHALNETDKTIVLTDTPLSKIDAVYKDKAVFEQFSMRNVIKYASCNTVFLSHHRKNTTFLEIFRIIAFWKTFNIIHVAHNTFSNLKYLSWLPKNIIAVSNGVKENLVDYFWQQPQNVHVVFNGIKDFCQKSEQTKEDGVVKVLLAGRICSVKQQVELAKFLKCKLKDHIKISFAGKGEQAEELLRVIKDDKHFEYLGFIDMIQELPNYDYVMLFSKNEGLPLSLVQGSMFGKPLITNDIKPVLDVNKDGFNGFVCSDFESLLSTLNTLPLPSSEQYIKLSRNSRNQYLKYFEDTRMFNQYRHIIENAFFS